MPLFSLSERLSSLHGIDLSRYRFSVTVQAKDDCDEVVRCLIKYGIEQSTEAVGLVD